ncbi:MAG: methyltransferase domain-containing protein [Nitrospirae bacterium]|nr:MAG: methyltransferase domain-containing protein [Nitrospirota bacterium]
MANTYADLMRLANAFSESQTLLAANDLDVFTVIGSTGRTAGEVARRCKADPEGMFLLLNALVGLGLLTLRKRRYYNTLLARRHLDRRSPEAISNLLWLLGHHWKDWTDIPHALRHGRPGWDPITETPEFRRRFSLAMHERSFMLAQPTVATFRLPPKARRFLDLGGGPGSYAIALAKRYPKVKGVVLDQTATVARQLIRKHRLQHRLLAREGSLFTADLGSGYDAVLVANVIHDFNEKENRALLKRVRDAIRPGGKVFIVEFFLDDSLTRPAKASVFSVMMYKFTASGRCYSWRETEGWLKELGFGRFTRRTVTPEIGTLEATRL